MSAKAQLLKLRLFLEGVESPVISAQVLSQPNAPAQAVIQVPPTSFATGLLPRTTVHLFFADPYEAQNPFVSFRGTEQRPKDRDPTLYEQSRERAQENAAQQYVFREDAKNSRYKLLFAGELVGFQWTKHASAARSVVLQCVDFSNYWDYAWQFNNTSLFGPGYKAAFSGGSTNLLTDFLSSPGHIVASLLGKRSAQYPALPGLLGGLIRMMEGIGGSYYHGDKFSGQNIFYSLAELRLRISQMITTHPKDDTAAKLLNKRGYGSLFGRTLGNLGDQVSFRTALTALMGIIFYEAQAIPSPYYIPGTGGTVSGQVRKKISAVSKYYGVYSSVVVANSALEQLKAVLSSPALEDASSMDARAFFSRLSNARDMINSALVRSRQVRLSRALAPLSSAKSAVGVALTKAKRDWKPGVFPGKKIQDVIAKIKEAQAHLKVVEDLDVNTTPRKSQIPGRLCSQVFKPDIWFTAPPRCNVLFPDQYTQLNYARNFMQEPTRFLLKTNNEFFGEDILFDQFFFAPQARTVRGQKRTLRALFRNDLMDHELFTGILPVFEKMGELNIFAVRSGTVQGKNPKVSLAHRSANFLYFKHRFAARQMQVTARFNPYLAPGFPCLVLDKYVDANSAKLFNDLSRMRGRHVQEAKRLLGTHFLGSITEMAHTVNQQEGQTSIRLSFPREYNEVTEFLGPALQEDQVVQQRYGTDAVRRTLVAALSPPPLGGIGPNFGVIDRVTEVTQEYTNPDPRAAFKFPLWTGARRDGANVVRTMVPAGPSMPAAQYGKEVVDLVGNPQQVIRFRVFELDESVPRYRREIVDLPAEELIRPGWYGNVWHPSKVGEVYYDFLGTGAITDQTQVADTGGLPTLAETTGNYRGAELDGSTFNSFEGHNADFGYAVSTVALDQGASIEQAVQFLLLTYSYIRQAGLDVDEFVKAYTWRPIATMVDMFGTSDLELSEDGTQVLQGIEGFHSRAFGPYEDLFGLVTPEITEILRIKRDDLARARADVRGRRYAAVTDYINSLQFSRALIG